jgi:hypothetical protein
MKRHDDLFGQTIKEAEYFLKHDRVILDPHDHLDVPAQRVKCFVEFVVDELLVHKVKLRGDIAKLVAAWARGALSGRHRV